MSHWKTLEFSRVFVLFRETGVDFEKSDSEGRKVLNISLDIGMPKDCLLGIDGYFDMNKKNVTVFWMGRIRLKIC